MVTVHQARRKLANIQKTEYYGFMLQRVLMSKAGLAAMQLAHRLASLNVGDRIPKHEELAAELDCGRGTVQAGFDLLANAGGIKLRSRGSLGTFVEEIDHAVLWDLSGQRSVSVAMPLPYSRWYEGLATGLGASFARSGIPLMLMFIRGSVARMRALSESRVDLVVMSSLAAESAEGIDIVHDYGPGSYVSSHALILASGVDFDDPDLRVGIDPSSEDQVRMAAQAFPSGVNPQRVPVSYNQLDSAFRDGLINATVWNSDEVHAHIRVPVTIHPLPLPDMGNTHAVIVRKQADDPIPVGVHRAIADPAVLKAARDVVDGRIVPTY